jgi:hypothetical protein
MKTIVTFKNGEVQEMKGRYPHFDPEGDEFIIIDAEGLFYGDPEYLGDIAKVEWIND